MYNYIDEVPEIIQDKVDHMTDDYDGYLADCYEREKEDFLEDYYSEIMDDIIWMSHNC